MKNKVKQQGRLLKYICVYFTAIFIAAMCGASFAIPESFTCFGISGSEPVSAIARETEASPGKYTVTAKLFGKVPVKDVDVEILPEKKLVPVGDVFGVKFFTKGVIVVGTTEIESAAGLINPAEISGIRKNDIIISVNGKDVNTVEDLAAIVENSKGRNLFIEYTRGNEELSCELTPVLSLTDKKYKTGIWVRDSTAGIGTVTYYNPETGAFAGLGHGICDIDTGEIMPLLKGIVVDVSITDITKGKTGKPGELKGIFSSEHKGEITKNTEAGVFGTLNSPPRCVYDAIPIASRDEVCEGDAELLANVDGKGIRKYSVSLSKVDTHSEGTKCFVVEITDEVLTELTGGIVQGMSGAPIIQGGKLIGAVTHVLVNDPTKGYGIFVENMLSKAEKIK